ncbi:trypsin domain-containing lipoprotein [Hyphomonas adhaerens MHS-3]|uniref:Trypsin domain-containing lipoprotein n=1 Tax=Hyphomonas adhaerens MHS-3 TaxID=1280949 RepID=A0A069E2K3_9PROT|nr:trypsin-like serine protease [Hyphomonas adhaerens]KCZ83745.1 trypsin domain-containing lipoprotein [Hyphomonas adhaerens MHS-3]
MRKIQYLQPLAGLFLLAFAACTGMASAQPDAFPDEDPSWPRTEFSLPDETAGTKGFNTQPARKEDWPFFAALRGTRNGLVTYDCGGTAISSEWVLTAAHCVEGATKNAATGQWERPGSGALQIVLGARDLKTVAPNQVYNATDVRIAPNFTRGGANKVPVNDIAVVKLDRPWNGPVVRLSASSASDVDRFFGPAYFAGFGKTDMRQKEPERYNSAEGPFAAYTDILGNAMIPTRSPKACSTDYQVDSYDSTSMICAGYDTGIIDSCQGDSGGPLIARDFAGRVYQIGIVSFGESCGVRGKPAVYTRVSGFKDFVQSVVPEAVFVDAKPEKTVYMTKAGLENLIRTLKPADGKVSVRINEGGSEFRSGERVRIFIDPSVKGRLWVFDLDPSGAVSCLFPCNAGEVDTALVEPQQSVVLPPGGVSISISPPTVPGDSTLAAFVLPERMALIGDTLPDLSRTKGPIRTVWQSYSDIMVFEVRDAMSDAPTSDPYANTGMGLLTYSVSE